ncbi:MAG: glutamate 5-kinase [Candidatus Pelagibacter sp. TMED118]|mgnify:FL=1|nr:MAG: glutamate 5-kinase [Candidatus Pelagibacter sp. TMED118]|tara:strand:- start:2483 stop:3589 length:1107 start_codon:yes stop_codon:yes gene_type:complete
MYLKNYKTIVIKVGSSLLIDKKKKIRSKWLEKFALDIKYLKKQKKNIVIVSSGAIALGCEKLKINKKSIKLDKSQAVASIGQIELMNLYKNVFYKYRINLSQILITLEDTEQRRRAINAKRTFENLFDLDYIPIVNENDSIATSEIKYGDNDRLASRVAQILASDCLILLSDVDGLYSSNPKINKNAKLIEVINNIDSNIKKIATKSIGEHGTGGMVTKIEAAKICQNSGCNMIIANGLMFRPILNIDKTNKGTWFLPKVSKLHARKKWIISSISPKGDLVIDDGAVQALKKGKSLLATGIKKVNGQFIKGDHIRILDKNNKEYARGLSSFSSVEIKKIQGQHSNKIKDLLGYVSKSEVIHKDDMVEI